MKIDFIGTQSGRYSEAVRMKCKVFSPINLFFVSAYFCE